MNKTEKKQIKSLVNISILPICVGVVAGFSLFFFIKKIGYDVNDSDFFDMVNTLIGILATLLGFIITAESILIGINGNKRMNEIIQTRHYKNVIYTYSYTCFILLICLITFIIVNLLKLCDLFIYTVFVSEIIISLLYVGMCIFMLGLMMCTTLKN